MKSIKSELPVLVLQNILIFRTEDLQQFPVRNVDLPNCTKEIVQVVAAVFSTF
jgi:hypothetical protein